MDENRITHFELDYRPLKDGLHDSGYRYLRLTTVDTEGNRTEVAKWADHVVVNGVVNIDVTRDGTIRIMDWRRGGSQPPWTNESQHYSSASFPIKTLNELPCRCSK